LDPTSTAKMLQTYGGWGVAVLCILAIIFLVGWIMKLQAKIEDHAEKTNKKLFDQMERRIKSDVENKQAFEKLCEVIEAFIRKM